MRCIFTFFGLRSLISESYTPKPFTSPYFLYLAYPAEICVISVTQSLNPPHHIVHHRKFMYIYPKLPNCVGFCTQDLTYSRTQTNCFSSCIVRASLLSLSPVQDIRESYCPTFHFSIFPIGLAFSPHNSVPIPYFMHMLGH